MVCREAPSLLRMTEEADSLAPRRNRASDGICGDVSHRLRRSDHNLGLACDMTHDPANGWDAHAHAQELAERHDPRIKYIISNRRIWTPSGGWRRYYGINGHTRHAHVSIWDSARNSENKWWVPITTLEEAMATGKFIGAVIPRDALPDGDGRWPFHAVTSRGEVFNFNMPTPAWGIKGLPERRISPSAPIAHVVLHPDTRVNRAIILLAEDGATFELRP